MFPIRIDRMRTSSPLPQATRLWAFTACGHCGMKSSVSERRIFCRRMKPCDCDWKIFLDSGVTKTPLFLKFHSKPLDGHPTPATPFVRLSTGASGVGIASSLGLAYGALDYYGKRAPYVHIVEGEGGLTPGRVSEALAAAGTASLRNAVLQSGLPRG